MPTLTRPTQPTPEDIDAALHKLNLRKAYDTRPPYQRNDYLSWIAKAKRTESRERRIGQMLSELATGGVYMGMSHAPSAQRRAKQQSLAAQDQHAQSFFAGDNTSRAQARSLPVNGPPDSISDRSIIAQNSSESPEAR